MKNKFQFLLLVIFLVFTFSFVSADELKVTEEHPFLINGSWIDASQLKVGDELTLVNGTKVIIKQINDIETETPFLVYNLEAGEYHNFVVGEDGVVVHNSYDPLDFTKTQNLEDIVNEMYDNLPTKDLTPFIKQRRGSTLPVELKPLADSLPVVDVNDDLRLVSIKLSKVELPSIKPSIELNQELLDKWETNLLNPSNPRYAAWAILNEGINKFRVIKEVEFWPTANRLTKEALDSMKGVTAQNSKVILVLSRKPYSSPNYVFAGVKNTLADSGQVEGAIFIGSRSGYTDAVALRQGLEFDALFKQGRRKFMILDDAAYSGTELGQDVYLQSIRNAYNRAKAAGMEFKEPVEVHIVVPYSTKIARAKIAEEAARIPEVKVVIHTSQDVAPTWGDLLPADEIATYNKAAANPLGGFLSSDLPMIESDTAAFVLEHKIADGTSLGYFGGSRFAEGLYRPTFQGYVKGSIDTVYKVPGQPLYNLDTFLFIKGNYNVRRTGTVRTADLFVFKIILPFNFLS